MDAAAAISLGRPVCRRCIIRSRSGCSSSSSATLHHRSRCLAVSVAPLRATPSSQARASKPQGLRLLTSRSQPPADRPATRKGPRNMSSSAARVGGDLAEGGLEKAHTRTDRSPPDNARDFNSRHAAAAASTVPTASPPVDIGSIASKSSSSVIASKSTNITWHECPVGQPERQALLGQKGCVVWVTGLSGSGKSTLACALARQLHTRGYLTYVLDGDNLRHGLNRDLAFSAEDRAENIRRVGEVARLFADAGVICIASLISPYRKDRDACRAMVPQGGFVEVYMDAPLEVCEARDPKGLYKLARAGKIKGFTGIDDPYEPPLDCEITLRQHVGDGAADTRCPSPTDMAEQVVDYLQGKGYLRA